MKAKPKGKPKFQPTTKEKTIITTMAAGGVSQSRIGEVIGRSRHMIKNTLAEPEMQNAVRDEKAELSALYREKARDILVSICAVDIDKANLLQKATSSAILLDKSLILSGEMPSININVLMDAVDAIRARPQGRPQAPALPPPEPES